MAGRPASANTPHVELHGPKGERLDSQGIVIPGTTISAHLTITDKSGSLWKIFGEGHEHPE